MSHPQVSNSAVIGVPDERFGEQVCAWISWRGGSPLGDAALKAAEESLREYLTPIVSHYKIPKYFLFKDDFPMTVTGKVQKMEMRKITERELCLSKSRL